MDVRDKPGERSVLPITIVQREYADAKFYVDMLDMLANRFNNKEKARTVYSYVILTLTVFFVGGLGVIVWHLSKAPSENIAAFITAIGGLLATLLGLPLIVVRSLFDKAEDEKVLGQMIHLMDEINKNNMAQHLEMEKDIQKEAEADEDRLELR